MRPTVLGHPTDDKSVDIQRTVFMTQLTCVRPIPYAPRENLLGVFNVKVVREDNFNNIIFKHPVALKIT
jgi:hypothetical protein